MLEGQPTEYVIRNKRNPPAHIFKPKILNRQEQEGVSWTRWFRMTSNRTPIASEYDKNRLEAQNLAVPDSSVVEAKFELQSSGRCQVPLDITKLYNVQQRGQYTSIP